MYDVVQIPTPPHGAENQSTWRKLADKFRALRLRSLQIAPEAFASTYEAENQHSLKQTFERILNPIARQFVATKGDSFRQPHIAAEFDIDDICKREWIGMIALIGPMESTVTARTDPIQSLGSSRPERVESSRPSGEGAEPTVEEFVLNGVLVEPSVRGSGVGSALVDTALEHAKGRRSNDSTVAFVTVLVNEENEQARKLYQRAGFVVVGQELYDQQPRALLGEVQAVEKTVLKMRLDLERPKVGLSFE